MRRVRHAGSPDTRYAMPVSHSQKLLCVLRSPATTVVIFAGFSGVVTSHTSCPELPNDRRRYTLLRSAFGSVLPLHTRAICAPPCSPAPASPGMWNRYRGDRGLVTSRIDVPFGSTWPVIGFGARP